MAWPLVTARHHSPPFSPLCTAEPIHHSSSSCGPRGKGDKPSSEMRAPGDEARPKPGPGDEAENAPAAARRKKGAAGVRTWLVVDAAGQTQVVEAGKHSIMRRTGLPARDLRILDPLLSYPSTVLGRERAIVVNLDRVKAIVTAHEVLLLNFQDPLVAPFVHDLQHRLHLRRIASSSPGATIEQEFDLGRGGADWASPIEANLAHSGSGSGSESPPLGYPADMCGLTEVDNAEDADGTDGTSNSVGQKVLPFEFIALETCLEAACSRLEKETKTLEQEAHPALDKLTSKISTLNLEHVRQIKSCLVAMIGRVQKVRNELEHLLDDDEDMAEMYLTEKQEQCDSSVSSSNRGLGDGGVPPHALSEAKNCEEKLEHIENAEILLSGSDADGSDSRTQASSLHSGIKRLDVGELEMLLEAYFVQVEGTLNKLSALREYVDDTEDYINIMLDDKQNQLLQMDVMLTTATLVASLFVALLGVFGMNIQIDPYDKSKSGMTEFLWTAGGGATGSLLLYVVVLAWCKQKRLLE